MLAHLMSIAWRHTLRHKALCALMVLALAVGIAGLTSFRVAQRRKHIGIRRALGATRRDILRYFPLENFAIVSAGILLGMLLAYALNLALTHWHELPLRPPSELPIAAVLPYVLGQWAVWVPARHAARVAPVIAMRS